MLRHVGAKLQIYPLENALIFLFYKKKINILCINIQSSWVFKTNAVLKPMIFTKKPPPRSFKLPEGSIKAHSGETFVDADRVNLDFKFRRAAAYRCRGMPTMLQISRYSAANKALA